MEADKAVGRVGILWIAFARFYEAHGDIESAAKVFERGVQAAMRTVDDLASVWCEAIEMHLRHNLFKQALQLARRCISSSKSAAANDKKTPQSRLYRSVKLWALVADVVSLHVI